MRILCLTPWFPPYPGAQSGSFILDAVEALHAAGHQVKVLVTRAWHPAWGGLLHPDWGRPALRPETHDPAFGVQEVRYASLPRNVLRPLSLALYRHRMVPAVLQACAGFRPDVLLAHTEQVGMAAVAAAAATGLPVVSVLHGVNTARRLNTAAERARVRAMLQACARVVVVGRPLLEHFAPIAGVSAHFRIVHNGFRQPPADLSRPHEPWPQTLRLISVSNLEEGKGVDLTLQALARLHGEGCRNWIYTIVGGGNENSALQALALRLGIAGQVRFTGAVDHADVYGLLAAHDVFVLPSWREAFGVAWLEAMACGLLAVGVHGQGPAEFIRHDETGLLVTPRDSDDLAACLRRILAEPQAMQVLAQRGREAVRRDFTWQAYAEKLVAVCREALGEQR